MTKLKYKIGDVVKYKLGVMGPQPTQEGNITEIDAEGTLAYYIEDGHCWIAESRAPVSEGWVEETESISPNRKKKPVKKQKIYVALGGAPNLLEETIIGVYNTKINSARAALQWISKQGEEYRSCLWGQQRKIDMVKDKSLKLWELSQSLKYRSIIAYFRQGKSVNNGYHWVRIVESNLN